MTCSLLPATLVPTQENSKRNIVIYPWTRYREAINIHRLLKPTLSAFGLGLSIIPFFINFFYSMFKGPKASMNPWESTTLEWTVPSPLGHGNFETTPTVYQGSYEYSVPGMEEDICPRIGLHLRPPGLLHIKRMAEFSPPKATTALVRDFASVLVLMCLIPAGLSPAESVC